MNEISNIHAFEDEDFLHACFVWGMAVLGAFAVCLVPVFILLGGPTELTYKIRYMTQAVATLADYQSGVLDLSLDSRLGGRLCGVICRARVGACGVL